MAIYRPTTIALDSKSNMNGDMPRLLGRDIRTNMPGFEDNEIETALGPIHASMQGDRKKPCILTYHDIGMTSSTCFDGFFNHEVMQPLLHHFCVCHVSAPGQQEGAPSLADTNVVQQTADTTSYVYPTMDQLAEMLLPVLQYYSLKSVIGFGSGAGANILSRFSLMYPEKTDSLILLNCSASQSGWMEWVYEKVNIWHLKSGQLSSGVEEYLLWHWFGQKTMGSNHDLVNMFSKSLSLLNAKNLGGFIDSYVRRTDLDIVRELDPYKRKEAKTLKCPVLLVSGDHSPHLDDTVNMNGRLDPVDSTWIKFDCGGMVLEECPHKMAESFRLFLQGMGYMPHISQIKAVEAHQKERLEHQMDDDIPIVPAVC